MTSLNTIKEQIYKFLASEKPEVMAITGDWGVGKTYAWETYLEEARDEGIIEFNDYSYVSLFGINSIKELRFAIFQNSINKEIIGTNPNLDTFKKNVTSLVNASNWKNAISRFKRLINFNWLKKIGKKSIPSIKESTSFYGLKGFAGQAIEAISYLSVSKTIICLDDFERTNLNVLDILGIISELKEKKDCKVILILNDSKLSEEDENVKKQFENHGEKVIEKRLKFKPTPEESADIRFDDKCDIPDKEFLKNNCIKLKITNIRIMNRIIRLWQGLQICIGDTPEKVKQKIASSLVLLCGSFYKDNENIPDIEFIKNYNPYGTVPITPPILFGDDKQEEKEKESEEEKEKRRISEKILTEYKVYSGVVIFGKFLDVLDEQILTYVENGYFEEEEFKKALDEYNQEIFIENQSVEFNYCYQNITMKLFNDPNMVINSLYEATKNYIKNIPAHQLNFSVVFLRELNTGDKADDLIKICIKERQDKEFFNLRDRPTELGCWDSEMEDEFAKEYKKYSRDRDLEDVFKKLPEKLNKEDKKIISKASVEKLVNFFEKKYTKKEDSIKLYWLIEECCKFDNGKKALKKIRDKNVLNQWLFDNVEHWHKINIKTRARVDDWNN